MINAVFAVYCCYNVYIIGRNIHELLSHHQWAQLPLITQTRTFSLRGPFYKVASILVFRPFSAPSHNSTHWWIIVNWTPGNILYGSLKQNKNATVFRQVKRCENVFYEMVAILSGPNRVHCWYIGSTYQIHVISKHSKHRLCSSYISVYDIISVDFTTNNIFP